jgi:hypothetical protein
MSLAVMKELTLVTFKVRGRKEERGVKGMSMAVMKELTLVTFKVRGGRR